MTNEQLFPGVSKAAWLAKVAKDLRGKALADLDFTVAGRTFSPFHHPEDWPEPPPPVRGPRTEPCRSGVALEITDPVADNQLILDLLNKGANALFLYSDTIDLSARLETVLDGVLREFIDVYTLQGPSSANIVSLQGPIVEMSTYDEGYRGEEGARTSQVMARMLRACADVLEDGLRPDERFTFWYEVDDDYLTSIARLRALRLCYRLIAGAYGIGRPCHIVADPLTKHTDKYTGMIATSAQVSAALVGGADTVFVPSGASDDAKEKAFLRRVAVNSYNVLDHEAYLNRVADPAAGSYYLETLTDHFARTAWAAFQQLTTTT